MGDDSNVIDAYLNTYKVRVLVRTFTCAMWVAGFGEGQTDFRGKEQFRFDLPLLLTLSGLGSEGCKLPYLTLP